MKFLKFSVFAAALAVAPLPLARATTIANFTVALTAANSTELGRFSRNSVPQDWSGTEAYPGVINPTTTYYYTVFTLPASMFTGGGFIEINTFEPLNTAVYFLSAYSGSYNVNSRATNWLGDQGFSGNGQTNASGDFQVILPASKDLVLVLNTTGGGTAGLGTAINLNIAAYADTMYTDQVPEPSTWLMVGTGLLGGAGAMRRRLFASA